jgi:hypothetical protein
LSAGAVRLGTSSLFTVENRLDVCFHVFVPLLPVPTYEAVLDIDHGRNHCTDAQEPEYDLENMHSLASG